MSEMQCPLILWSIVRSIPCGPIELFLIPASIPWLVYVLGGKVYIKGANQKE